MPGTQKGGAPYLQYAAPHSYKKEFNEKGWLVLGYFLKFLV